MVADDRPYATHDANEHTDTERHALVFMDDEDIESLLVVMQGQVSFWEVDAMMLDDYLDLKCIAERRPTQVRETMMRRCCSPIDLPQWHGA